MVPPCSSGFFRLNTSRIQDNFFLIMLQTQPAIMMKAQNPGTMYLTGSGNSDFLMQECQKRLKQVDEFPGAFLGNLLFVAILGPAYKLRPKRHNMNIFEKGAEPVRGNDRVPTQILPLRTMGHIEADPGDQGVVPLFHKDSSDLPSLQKQVVGPFDLKTDPHSGKGSHKGMAYQQRAQGAPL
jgi:hypothetical protein